ncbi:hypothetical protein L2E82_33557 [Cichorium intybus]|uniref:Uncharacterized protein n=1 Tax=Cichorium intybus TaxID=13427 RepID=A0ACB9BKH2_CICIN|nr:hypothetical protein L2E82_33557 [Cichorium intybus]
MSYVYDFRLPVSDQRSTTRRLQIHDYAILISSYRYILEDESVFSIGGRVLDVYRSSLKADTAELIVCLRDWVFKESSLQPEVEALCKKVTTLKVDVEDGENESIKSSSQTQNSSFG